MGQVFPAYAMMRAPEPYLQVAGDLVYSRQESGSALPCPLGLRSVVIALRLQGNHTTSCALVSQPDRHKPQLWAQCGGRREQAKTIPKPYQNHIDLEEFLAALTVEARSRHSLRAYLSSRQDDHPAVFLN
jgi:hypothetical protein